MEEQSTIVPTHEYETPMYDVISDFCKDPISLQPSDLPSTQYHGSDFAKYYNVDLYVENGICVVDPCHNQDDLRCQPLEGEKLMEHLLCEPHHLSG